MSSALAGDDVPGGRDAYADSKRQAEDALMAFASESGLELVIVRPPLVYGPGVGGNFRTLIGIVRRGLPLPLGLITNRRSLVGTDNLADALVLCASHPEAAGGTFAVSDGPPVSTPDLLRRLAAALDRPVPRLFPVPPLLLRGAGSLSGRRRMVEKVIGSLVVDDGPLRNRLGWRPILSLDEGLRRLADAERSATGIAEAPEGRHSPRRTR